MGQDELLFDELPDTMGHLIAVHLQHQLSLLDLVVGIVAPRLVLQVGACRPGWPRAQVSAESECDLQVASHPQQASERARQAGSERQPLLWLPGGGLPRPGHFHTAFTLRTKNYFSLF